MRGGQGLLWISIDLELDLKHHDFRQETRLDAVRQELIRLFTGQNIPATWAVADPLYSAATESILAAGGGQELAVLGDEAWLGPGCGRARLARELARRFTAARQAGIPVSTLAVRHASAMPEQVLLHEHGVSAFCPPATAQRPARTGLHPVASTRSVWQSPVPWRLPVAGGWWSWSGWCVWRAIRQAVGRGAPLHLRLESLPLLDAPQAAFRWLASLLGCLDRHRQQGQLTIQTLGASARQWLSARSTPPSRSILLPAA